MTHIDVAPPPAERDLANLDALTAGLALVAAEARAQGERDAAALADVRAVLVEWGGSTDMSAAHALAKIAAAVNR
jgi:hypothetical protein